MPRRILNIMLAKVKGGVEAMAATYHRALEAEGFEVASVGHPDGVLPSAIPANAFRPLVARYNHDPLAALRLYGYLRDFKPDLVLTHGNRATGLALLPGMPSAERTVAVLHNQFFKGHMRHLRGALCVSESVMTAAKQAFPGLALVAMPNFAPLVVHPVKAAPQDVPAIGAIGRLHEQKGFDRLIEAAVLLHDRGVRFTLDIAGEGEDRGLLQRLIAHHGLEAMVRLAGWVSPPDAFLAGRDLVVVPSRYEPFGLVVIEAMAAGVPVVASALEGPLEILADGRFGGLFDGADTQSIASAIAGALEDYQSAAETARLAQAHAVETYGFAAGAERLRRGILSLVEGAAVD